MAGLAVFKGTEMARISIIPKIFQICRSYIYLTLLFVRAVLSHVELRNIARTHDYLSELLVAEAWTCWIKTPRIKEAKGVRNSKCKEYQTNSNIKIQLKPTSPCERHLCSLEYPKVVSRCWDCCTSDLSGSAQWKANDWKMENKMCGIV